VGPVLGGARPSGARLVACRTADGVGEGLDEAGPTSRRSRSRRVEHGRRGRRPHQALRDAPRGAVPDLQVREGEVFGFLGPNGAGKSTTIRLVLDLIRPSAGTVRVLGVDPATHPRVRARIGHLPGELALNGRQDVAGLLRVFARLSGGVPQHRVHGLAERLGLDLTRQVRGLSKGNKQKVGLVQAFMHAPDLLVLDEPTSGLDPLVQREFLSMVREARTAGQTVFLSSHVLSEVEEVADRIALVRDGRLVLLSDVAALRARSRLEVHVDRPVPPPEDFAATTRQRGEEPARRGDRRALTSRPLPTTNVSRRGLPSWANSALAASTVSPWRSACTPAEAPTAST